MTKTGLFHVLKGVGPFTVFAPTDAAFATTFNGLGVTSEQVLDCDVLADILKYHVVPSAKVMSYDWHVEAQNAGSLMRFERLAAVADGNAVVHDALVNVADVAAIYVVIHVIDKVLALPSAIGNYDVTSTTDGNFERSAIVQLAEEAVGDRHLTKLSEIQ